MRHVRAAAVMLVCLALPASAAANNQTVTAGSTNQFTPAAVTVFQGEKVTWNNVGGFHNVHFDDNSFVQPPSAQAAPWTVSRTFTSPGTFGYHCDLHVSVGMTGTVTVAPATGYVRPKGATPVLSSLVVAYKPCAAPNRVHGGGLPSASCNGPVPESTFLTAGTPDANMAMANMAGSIRADVKVGDPANMVDDSDVLLRASLSDIRRKSDLLDYTGELQGSLTLRITDRHNGASLSDPATVVDTPFTFAVPCAATSGDPATGSTCTVDTTADAVLPGSVPEGKKAIWELRQVRAFDGGSDGVASTAGNTLFATEGVFSP